MNVAMQNQIIGEVLDEFKNFLQGKNASYNGAVFQDLLYCGKTILAEDTIDIRINDKIRRLRSGKTYAGDDDERDLCGYLILKFALAEYRKRASDPRDNK